MLPLSSDRELFYTRKKHTQKTPLRPPSATPSHPDYAQDKYGSFCYLLPFFFSLPFCVLIWRIYNLCVSVVLNPHPHPHPPKDKILFNARRNSMPFRGQKYFCLPLRVVKVTQSRKGVSPVLRPAKIHRYASQKCCESQKETFPVVPLLKMHKRQKAVSTSKDVVLFLN